MVSQVLGSNAVLCRAVVLFCEISGFCVLVVCLLLGLGIVIQNRIKKKPTLYQGVTEVP